MIFEMSLLFKSDKQADKGVFYFQILAESLVDNIFGDLCWLNYSPIDLSSTQVKAICILHCVTNTFFN